MHPCFEQSFEVPFLCLEQAVVVAVKSTVVLFVFCSCVCCCEEVVE